MQRKRKTLIVLHKKMDNHSENTKRIAKNTLLLYVRKFFSMLVSLYTARVVLKTLGVEDYGISSVVGGVIGMIGFLNDSMSGATSRFLTYELGRGDKQRMKETFATALIIHVGIALIVFLFAETIGLWFLENKLVIPAERMNAARIVYQMAVLSTMIGISQVPYNACLVAHEKFDVYAYVDILNVVLRLLIVYLLVIINFDKLILWSLLGFVVSLLIMTIYRLYCTNHYEESRFHFVWKTDYIKPMLSFSGWDLYGNMSVMARTTGVNMLLNMFFGPVMNTAAGIATQVQSCIMGFAGNLVTAMRPQLVKQYACKEYESMFGLLQNGIKMAFVLLSLFSIPLMCEAHFVLQFWLGMVPNYTVIFCVLTLLFNFFANMSVLLVSVIHATGNIKRPSFINGTLYLLVVPFSYIAYRLGCPPWFAFLFNVLAVILGMLSNAWTIRLYIQGFSFKEFFFQIFLKCVGILIIVSSLVYMVRFVMEESWLRLIISVLFSSLLLSLSSLYILFGPSFRKQIYIYLNNKLCRKA